MEVPSPLVRYSYPPFDDTETFHEIRAKDGRHVLPQMECIIDKGFFLDSDKNWVCYARNTLSVQCSYILQPWVESGPLFLHYRESDDAPFIHTSIQYLAMVPRAEVVGQGPQSVGLFHHSRNRGRISWLPLKIEPLSPKVVEGMQKESSMHLQAGPILDQGLFDLGRAVPTERTSHHFERMHLKDTTADNGKRRQQQRQTHLQIIVDMYADIRLDANDAPRWMKIAHRRSVNFIGRGRVAGMKSSTRKSSH